MSLTCNVFSLSSQNLLPHSYSTLQNMLPDSDAFTSIVHINDTQRISLRENKIIVFPRHGSSYSFFPCDLSHYLYPSVVCVFDEKIFKAYAFCDVDRMTQSVCIVRRKDVLQVGETHRKYYEEYLSFCISSLALFLNCSHVYDKMYHDVYSSLTTVKISLDNIPFIWTSDNFGTQDETNYVLPMSLQTIQRLVDYDQSLSYIQFRCDRMFHVYNRGNDLTEEDYEYCVSKRKEYNIGTATRMLMNGNIVIGIIGENGVYLFLHFVYLMRLMKCSEILSKIV